MKSESTTPTLFVPRMVHTEVHRVPPTPTWNRILDHLCHQTGLQSKDRRSELNEWIRGLVSFANRPQSPLVLIGPDCSGKRTFHHAMGLLLPDHAVLQFPPRLPKDEWTRRLNLAWLLVIEGHLDRFVNLAGHTHRRGDRYLKWCLIDNRDIELDALRFDASLLPTTIPRIDLLRRLEDERDLFRQTLF